MSLPVRLPSILLRPNTVLRELLKKQSLEVTRRQKKPPNVLILSSALFLCVGAQYRLSTLMLGLVRTLCSGCLQLILRPRRQRNHSSTFRQRLRCPKSLYICSETTILDCSRCMSASLGHRT